MFFPGGPPDVRWATFVGHTLLETLWDEPRGTKIPPSDRQGKNFFETVNCDLFASVTVPTRSPTTSRAEM